MHSGASVYHSIYSSSLHPRQYATIDQSIRHVNTITRTQTQWQRRPSESLLHTCMNDPTATVHFVTYGTRGADPSFPWSSLYSSLVAHTQRGGVGVGSMLHGVCRTRLKVSSPFHHHNSSSCMATQYVGRFRRLSTLEPGSPRASIMPAHAESDCAARHSIVHVRT